MGEKRFSLEISKFSLALQPETLVNMSGRVLFSSPDLSIISKVFSQEANQIRDKASGAPVDVNSLMSIEKVVKLL